MHVELRNVKLPGGPAWEKSFTKFVGNAAKELKARLGRKKIEDCSKALEKNPKDYNALANRAYLRMLDEDYKKARQDLNAALMIKPDDAVALSLRALANHALGNDAGFERDAANADRINAATSALIFIMATGSTASPFMRAQLQ